MSKALVVLSGGLDSCVALGLALRDCDEAETVTFWYGQKHRKELEAAKAISKSYGVKNTKVDVALAVGDSVLMNHEAEMPHMTYQELQEAEGPSPTYVPYRNGTFLSLAASKALDIEADYIYAGMHADDAHNWAYPDCTPEFIGAMQNAIYIGTYMKVRLVCPFTYMDKSEIITTAVNIGAPIYLTWSCYEGNEVACGRCPTCVARLEAFRELGMSDPIEYEFDKYREGHSRDVVASSLKLIKELDNE